MSVMIHGTYTMYAGGHCRCFDCTVAATEQASKIQRRKGGFADDEGVATRGEVREWANSLGFTIAAKMTGPKADALVARYNREHPTRPYLRPSDGGVVAS